VTEAFGGEVGKAAASSYGPSLDPISGSVGSGRSEVCWAVVTPDGRFLYALDADARRIFAFEVGSDGSPTAGSTDGLPATAAGLAAS
jgi:hypothetical protein